VTRESKKTLISTPEQLWKWLCRGLATVGFVYLLITNGVNAPWGFYMLLLGLFFGPEVVAGQIQINRRVEDRDH
jgi:hypothetical protein